ncbi:hypothetical protein BDZ45DRAFT_44193 [Acephala macrosclerotiorum]|nr:hypothetical protein BDZ45DRAFT_44193 [Acephala macrosclerotiorum]
MMLRGLEKTFDAPPKVITASFDVEQSPITWLDVVTFASANPDQFVLSESDGSVSCRCWIRGARIEITKDDHRLIKSGLPKNLIPVQPLADDESAELETIHILEARLQSLIKQSDGVAGKARQLNYHLKGRKNALVAKKADSLGNVDVESRTYSPQAFPAVNARSSQGPNGEANKLQSELLTHYRSLDERSSASHDRRTSLPPGRDSRPKPGRMSTSDGFKTDSPDVRRNSQPNTSSEDGSDRRAIMAARIERLNRGDPIQPKCDRCRRLKFECTKHLTACQACTKKHAKCSWRDVTDEELETGPHASMVAPPPSQRPTASAGNGYLPAEVTSQPRATSSINSYNSAENTSRLPTTSAEEADFVPQASMSASRHPSSAHTHFSSADSSLFAQSGPRTAAPRQPILNDRWKKLQDLQAEMETDE